MIEETLDIFHLLVNSAAIVIKYINKPPEESKRSLIIWEIVGKVP